jgi:hypothetical protein
VTVQRFDSVPGSVDPLEDHLNRQAERSRDFFWNRVRWELVSSHLPQEPFEIVDVGAGPGFLGDFLAENRPDAKYRFVEPIEGLEQGLEARFGADSNWRDRDFAGASHLVLLDVLEHIGDDRAFLAELAEKMDPGATLLLTVPALPRLWSKWDLLLGHYRRYTKPMLAAAAEPLPLEIVESSYLFPELVPVGWWRRQRERHGAAATDAEFPDLPRPLNEALYRLGSATKSARRLAPAGTSLFAVIRRTT